MTTNLANEHPADHPEDGPADASRNLIPVVCLAGAAGGPAALAEFLNNLPEDTGLAFVLLFHLPKRQKRKFIQSLPAYTKLPVCEVSDREILQADHLYVAAPDSLLLLSGGLLQAVPAVDEQAERAVIDNFLTSLAVQQGERAVAILFSGQGADGVLGLQAIKAHGGLTLAQTPEDAGRPHLLRRAIATGDVDIVDSAGDLAAQLVTRRGHLADSGETTLDSLSKENAAFVAVLAHVRSQTGHDFMHYKRSTLWRRLSRRMQLQRVASIEDYVALLHAHPEETRALLRDFLISVTSFFRDPAAFELLERDCVPQLFIGKKRSDAVRVWIVGCATGEEAYSIAMLLSEYAASQPESPRLQVFATDIDEEALAFARRGLYPRSVAEVIAPARLQRFFVEEANGYRIRLEIREMVLFAAHNVLRDPPFSQLDLISCRNLMIYFAHEAQEHVLDLFHFALNPTGYLFLGTSESADVTANLFSIRDKRCHLYQRRDLVTPVRRILPVTQHLPGSKAQSALRPSELRTRNLEERYQQWALRRYAPPRLLVNENYQLTHIFGGAERYLRGPEGAVTHHVLQKILPELRLDLHTALDAALNHGRPTASRRIQVVINGEIRSVQMKVELVDEPHFPRNIAEIAFDEQALVTPTPATAGSNASGEAKPLSPLEEEFDQTRMRLQAIIEDHEQANEELKTSNEELQSINEELKSTTEELETSKEELQSMNEELVAVNQELKRKLDEISRINSDLLNLIASTDVGSIFLDCSLCIKRFTPRITEIFHLKETDLGRPLAHISHQLHHARVLELASRVLETLETREEIVQSLHERWYILRLFPYRTVENTVDGVTLTLIDITDHKRAEHEVRQRIQQEAVADLGRLALRETSIDTLFAAATARIANILGVEYCGVFEHQPGEETLVLRAGFGWPESRSSQVTVPAGANSQMGHTLLLDKPLMVEELHQETRFHPSTFMLGQQIASGANVVIGGRERPYGVLGIYSATPHRFADYDTDFLQSVANVLAEAIERRQIEDGLRRSQQMLQGSLDALTKHIAILDRTGVILNINAGWRRFADENGYTGVNYGIGTNYLQICEAAVEAGGASDPQGLQAAEGIRSVIAGETPLFTMEYPCHSLTEQRWFVMRVTAFGREDELRVVVAHENITASKQAEDALRRSEQRFQQLAESMPQIVWVTDADGNVRYINRRWREYTGISLEESLASPVQAIHPDDRPSFEAHWVETLRREEPLEYEIRLRRYDGLYFWHLVRSVPVRDEQGVVVRWYGTSTEIDDRKRSERNSQFLSELTLRLRMLDDPAEIEWATVSSLGEYLGATHCNFAEIDAPGDLATVRQGWQTADAPALASTYSLSKFDLPGLRLALEQGRTVVANDVAVDERTAPAATAFEQLGVRSVIIVPYLHGGQWVAALSVSCRNVRAWRNDEVALVEALAARTWPAIKKAQTELALRANEGQLRLITDAVPGLISYVDAEQCYRFVNATYERWYRLPRTQILGRHMADLLGEENYKRIRPYVEAALAGQAVSYENDMTYVDGRKTVLATYVPDIQPDGRVAGFYALVTDMSKQKKTEQLLRQQASLLDQTYDAIVVWDLNGGIQYWNKGAETLYGWTSDEVLGRITHELWQTQHSVSIEEINVLLLQKGRWAGEVIHHTRDGRTLIIESRRTIVHTSDGQDLVLETNRDITQRKQAENELRESEERFRQLAESIHDVFWINDPIAQRTLYVSAVYEQQWGFNSQELYEDPSAWWNGVHPEDRERARASFHANAHRGTYDEEYRMIRPDGAWRWVRDRGFPIRDSAGVVVRITGVAEDITARKEVELALAESNAILRAINEGTSDLIFVKDGEGRYIMANPAFCRVIGRHLEEIIGKTDLEILEDPDDAAIIMENDRRIMAAGAVEMIEESALLPGGERIYLSTKSPYIDEQGAVVGLIGIATEITERKRYERELFELNQTLERRVSERTAELERSNRELDQFAYVASHDLKAPLRAIDHLATWIAEDAGELLPAASQKHLEKLRGRVRRMEKLLADLLTYSRAGRLHHAFTLVDTGTLVRDIIDTLAPPATFTITIEEPMPCFSAEQVPLELVLRNLIANAIKHHVRPNGHIRISAREDGEMISFTISDDGPGIAPEFHQRIFEMFQTLQPKDQIESSGMGLAIVKKVVESAGGAITVDSAPGKGASFTFTWPQ